HLRPTCLHFILACPASNRDDRAGFFVARLIRRRLFFRRQCGLISALSGVFCSVSNALKATPRQVQCLEPGPDPEGAAKLMKRAIRIGAVNYLNTKPLIYQLEQLAPEAELILDLPSRLADRLEQAEL